MLLKLLKFMRKGVIGIGDFTSVKKMRNEMSKWLDGYHWDVWFTGTFKPEMALKDTITTKKCFDRFLADLKKEHHVNKGMDFFIAVERFKHGEYTHIHALLNGVGGLTNKDIWQTWFKRYGRAVVEDYNRKEGAAHYVTKYVTKSICDWDLSIRPWDGNYRLFN